MLGQRRGGQDVEARLAAGSNSVVSDDPDIKGKWIPQVGDRVKFRTGMSPVPTWSELELTVVKVLDPEKGLVAVQGKHWVVTQHVLTSKLQPYPGGGP